VSVKALNACICVVSFLHAVQDGPFRLADNAEVDILQCSCSAFVKSLGKLVDYITIPLKIDTKDQLCI